MKKSIICFLMLLFLIISAPVHSPRIASATSPEEGLKITSRSALLMDYSTGKIIFAKNEEERLPIASMTKLASLSVIFDALDKGAIKESDMVRVSETAASVGGSSAFLDAGASYKVSDLIKSVIIASANDSCVALAEHVAGSEDVFVSRMNKLAKNLGLTNTNFVNATGLPEKEHYSSALDISKIYRTVCNHALYKKYAKIWMDDFIHPSGRKTGLVNTNRLIRTFDGIDGGKTGYTDSARFCLTTSATRGATRLIAVVIGATDSKTRFKEAATLLNFGFSNYETKLVVSSQIPVAKIDVARSKASVDVFAERDCLQFGLKDSDAKFSTDFKLNEVAAPLKAGDKVGTLYVFDKDNVVVDEVNLIVSQDVAELKFADFLHTIFAAW